MPNNDLFFSYWTKPLKVHELIEELEGSDSEIPENIYIFPPDNANNENTDEDSGEEDNVELNNLPGSQLRAEVEIRARRSIQTRDVEDASWDSDDDLPLATFVKRSKIVSKKKRTYKWTKNDIISDFSSTWETICGPKPFYTPLQAFLLFF